MTVQAISPKTEFHVDTAHQYDQANPIRWILSHLALYKWWLAAFFVSITATNILNAAVPRQIGAAFNVVTGEMPTAEPFRAILTLTFIIVGLGVGRFLCDALGSFSMEVVAKRLERDGRSELYLNLLGKSQTFHNQQRVGDIMARAANDVRFVNEMMMPGFSLLYDSMMAILMPIIFIGFIDIRLLLAPLAFCVTYFFAVRHYMRQLDPVSDAVRARFGDMNGTLNEAVTGIEVVKAAAQERQEMGKFLRDARQYRNAFVKQGEVQARYIPTLLIGVAIAGAFVHGVYLLQLGEITIGDLIGYMGLMWVLQQHPAILILDEATASVDPLAEAQIQESLELVLQDRTAIIIAHRLSTIKHADRIIVLREGEIIEEGNHTSLMRQQGHYAELYNTYFRHQSPSTTQKAGTTKQVNWYWLYELIFG